MVVIFIDKNTDNGFGYATQQQQQQQQQQPSYLAGADFVEEPQSFVTHFTAQPYGVPAHQHQHQPQQQQRYHGARNHYGSAEQQQHHHRYLLAERYKTKTCRNHMMTGACPYGHRCMFAHGVHELRTTDMNVRDGLMTEEAIRSFQRAMTAYNRGELAQMMSQDNFVYSSGVAPFTAPQQQQQQQHDAAAAAGATTTAACECANCHAARATHNPYYAAMPPATALGHPSQAPIQQHA